jgi:hypothetical protein
MAADIAPFHQLSKSARFQVRVVVQVRGEGDGCHRNAARLEQVRDLIAPAPPRPCCHFGLDLVLSACG